MRTLTLRLDDELIDRIKDEAWLRDLSFNALCARLLERGLNNLVPLETNGSDR